MKHIVITGSTRGIGRGLAEQFLKKGHHVTINGTTQQGVDIALSQLQSNFPNQVQGFVANTVHYEEMERLFSNAEKGFGPIHIWINNAGVDQMNELFLDIPMENVKRVIDVNIIGMMNGSQVAAKGMIKQGFGQIFNMEGLGSNGMMMPRSIVYGTSKCALTYFTQAFAKELKGSVVQVGRISPGMVLTDLLLNAIPTDDPKREKELKNIYNILADHVEPVTHFLVTRMLKNTKHNAHINWLNNVKIGWRFATSKVLRRKVI